MTDRKDPVVKIRIRTKLAAALAVPLVALVAIAGYEAVEASREADEIRAQTELADVAVGPGSLISTLRQEKNAVGGNLVGFSDEEEIPPAREATDQAVEDLETYLAGQDDASRRAFAPAFEVLQAELAEARRMYDDYDGDKSLDNQPYAAEVHERYGAISEAFFAATERIATEIDEAALRNGVELVDQSNRRSEFLANTVSPIAVDVLTDADGSELRAQVAATAARADATEERIRQLSVGPYGGVAEETLVSDSSEAFDAMLEDYLAGEELDLQATLAPLASGIADQELEAPGNRAQEILDAQAAALTSAAETREWQFLVLAGGTVAVAVLFSWLVSRSITTPLRSLREQAGDMARARLPRALREISETPLGRDVRVPELEPIRVETRDEVADVVEVLNDVQDRTLHLAADQAVLRRNVADSFVNLGRRNQNLLDRQLEFITELEQSETEPEELESLFRLDHLATRMRRNAESLLVLAGVESPRQWSAPVAVDDVVRAALGEVEDYRRVSIRHLDDVAVRGEAAAGVSHVLAELIENALQFSPPESPVEVKGRSNAGGYMIAIDDDGIGMSPESIERANRRLSGDESYTVAPSRYLGHYVAGHLAERLGIEVRLQDSPAGGVTATVRVPASVLAAAAEDLEPEGRAGAPDGRDGPAGPALAGAPVEPAAQRPALEEHAPEEHAPEPAVPSTLDEALGRPAISSIETVDDLTAAFEGPAEDGSTSSLPRRVPGAQRPDRQPTTTARSDAADPGAGDAADADVDGDGAGEEQPGRTDALGFLAGFSAATAEEPSWADVPVSRTTTDLDRDDLPDDQPDEPADHTDPEDR